MAEAEELVLKDKNVHPDDKMIFSIIGDKKPVWQAIMSHMHENYKDISEEWRFYNDGKQWLFKMQQKKKTIFWIGILKDTFRITFYFGDKAEPLIETSELAESMKKDFKTGKRYGAIRAVSIQVSGMADADAVFKLAAIKTKMK